jgi:uncharacterized protein YegL
LFLTSFAIETGASIRETSDLGEENNMKKLRLILLLVAILSLTTLHLGSVGAQGPTIQLAMLLDGSTSIASADFSTMLNGLASAVENSACVPQDGSLELTVIQFSSSAQVEVDPTVITAANADAVAASIRAISQMGGLTYMDLAIDAAVSAVTGSANFPTASKQVFNLSTDGQPTDQGLAITAQQNAIAAGIDEIDAEGVGDVFLPAGAVVTTEGGSPAALEQSPAEWMRDNLVYPQPGTIYGPGYETWPPTAPGWVRLVANFDEYATTICEKFEVVVEPTEEPTAEPTPEPPPPVIPEASTIVLLAGAASGLAGYVGLQYRARRRK